MDNDTFESILRGEDSRPPHDSRWVMVRLIEYAPYADIRRLLPRERFLEEWPGLATRVRSRMRREGMDFRLFADPIAVQTPDGQRVIQPQRTNDVMERFFLDFRRRARRKSGHNSISRFLQSMIADTPLVRTLENPRHLKILLNGQPTLEHRFAQIDIETEVPREFGVENTIWPLFFKGFARLVDFLARAYAHLGFRRHGWHA
jgi:hypothetical protein